MAKLCYGVTNSFSKMMDLLVLHTDRLATRPRVIKTVAYLVAAFAHLVLLLFRRFHIFQMIIIV